MGKKIKFNALDLFAGAGGMSQGMKNAGFDVIAAIEYNEKIAKTYEYNHPETKMFIDNIKNISADSVKEVFDACGKSCDVIFGGPPCQGFSMAGKRIRQSNSFLEDPRNFLFKEYIRMVEKLNPKIFVIENVPGILNYNDGMIKNEIYETFEKLGYSIKSRVLCAADYGVPQIRHRAIFIGTRLDIDPETLFPIPTNNAKNYVTIRDAISDLPRVSAGMGNKKTKYKKNVILSNYQKKMISKEGYVYNHISSHHTPETLKILSMVKQGQTMKDLPSEFHTKSVHSGAYGRMIYDKPAYTLTTRLNTPSVGRITHPEQNRTITPREAARIQSFPDNYYFIGDITSIGIQIGNAVPPLLAESIGNVIYKALQDNCNHK